MLLFGWSLGVNTKQLLSCPHLWILTALHCFLRTRLNLKYTHEAWHGEGIAAMQPMNAARVEKKHMGMALKPVFVVQGYAAMIGDSTTHEEAAEVGHGPLAQPGEEYLTANWLLAVLGHVSGIPAISHELHNSSMPC